MTVWRGPPSGWVGRLRGRIHDRLDAPVVTDDVDGRLPQDLLAAAAGEGVAGTGVGQRDRQRLVVDRGDLRVLAEQDPGEAPLELDRLQDVRPQASHVDQGEPTLRRGGRGRLWHRRGLGNRLGSTGRARLGWLDRLGLGHRLGRGLRLAGGGSRRRRAVRCAAAGGCRRPRRCQGCPRSTSASRCGPTWRRARRCRGRRPAAAPWRRSARAAGAARSPPSAR